MDLEGIFRVLNFFKYIKFLIYIDLVFKVLKILGWFNFVVDVKKFN